MKKTVLSDCRVIGFALFGMFFGAGNLIFPPFLGLKTGENWYIGFICFLIFDVVLAVLAILSICKNGNDATVLTDRLGSGVSKFILIANAICLGPLVAVPRTAATSFEFSVKPLLGDSTSFIIPLIFTLVFFGVVIVLSQRQSQIITVIGAYLAPLMFLSLIFLIIKGILNPLGVAQSISTAQGAVYEGINAGYQTMDVMAAVIFASSIISGVAARGYDNQKSRLKVTAMSSLIAIVALGIVYGGLCYLGAGVSSQFTVEISRTQLLLAVVTGVMGKWGAVFLGVLVLIACLTAAIGILSSSAAFIQNITKGKVSYKKTLFLFSGIGFLLSNLGTEKIMMFAAPVLNTICPVLITIVFLGFINKYIISDTVYKASCLTAFIVSLISYIESSFNIYIGINTLPLAQYSFAWLVPTLIVFVITMGDSLLTRRKDLIGKEVLSFQEKQTI